MEIKLCVSPHAPKWMRALKHITTGVSIGMLGCAIVGNETHFRDHLGNEYTPNWVYIIKGNWRISKAAVGTYHDIIQKYAQWAQPPLTRTVDWSWFWRWVDGK